MFRVQGLGCLRFRGVAGFYLSFVGLDRTLCLSMELYGSGAPTCLDSMAIPTSTGVTAVISMLLNTVLRVV